MKEYLNYFSKADKSKMLKFSQKRYELFKPISKILTQLKITPNAVSYFGVVLLLGFSYYAVKKPLVAGIFLVLHVLIDAFDGPLAKYQKRSGNKGALTDMLCDHSGLAIVTITLIYYGLISGTIGAAYLYVYTLLIIFTIIRNNMGVPPKLAFRSKYFLYLCFIPYITNGINILNIATLIFTLIKIPFTIISFIKIRKAL
jgi:phosphatidylglycerophosphate synthase